MNAASGTPEPGTTVVHRCYVPTGHAHYAGNLVDGAYSLGLFGDAATELCIRTDGDEGLFACYEEVQFRAPVRAGDVLEVTAELIGAGTRSRRMRFTATVVCRGTGVGSGAELLAEPVVATEAIGTVVVPARPEPARHARDGQMSENLGRSRSRR